MTTFAATTLIIEISWRAARLPAVSIFHAAQRQEPGLVGLHPRLGDEVLDELLVGELAAERLALAGAVAHHLRRARRRRSRACSGGSARARSRSWAITNPGAAPRARSPRARGSPRSESQRPGPPSWPITDTGRTSSNPGLSIGTRIMLGSARTGDLGPVTHHDCHGCADRSRGEPFVAVDHPLVAVEHGLGAKRCRRVGPRDLGLGHREATPDLSLEQWHEPARALLVRSVLGEDLPCSPCPGPSS